MNAALRAILWLAVPVAIAGPVAALAQAAASPFTTGYRYDVRGRQTGVISPDPGGGPAHYLAVRNTYDAAGNLIKVEQGALASWQADSVAPAAWTGFTVYRTTDTGYDVMDRKARESASAGGTTYNLTQFNYDARGRLQCTAVRMTMTKFAQAPADACALTPGVAVPDRITKQLYDTVDQLLTVRKALGTPLQQDYATYTYSPNGKRTSVKDANANLATLAYDGFDRLSRWTFPKAANGQPNAADYESYGYDENDNRVTYRKRDGRALTYAYDALNRMTSKIIPDGCAPIAPTPTPPCPGSNSTRDVYYAYDLRGLQLSARFDGPAGADLVSSAYDGFGRQTSSTTSMAGITRTLTYLWDADGNRIRITHPDGEFFATAYDGLDRATVTTQPNAGVVDDVSYDARGYQSGRFGGLETFDHDAPGRLSAVTFALPATANDVVLGFGYNPADQVTTQTRDAANDAYSYAGYVNGTRGYTPNRLNQYASIAGTAYRYDASGNLVSDATNTYTYDAENRLVASAGPAMTLVYDALGRLYRASGPGLGNARFLYDGDALVGEYDPDGSILERYVHGTGADDPLAWYPGGSVTTANRRLLFADQQGSIAAVTNRVGALVQANAYDEWGNPAASNLGRFGFTGQAWIAGLNLYYYKARMYSASDGRFLQTDPVGYDDQINLYAYVANDPVNKTDPTGKDTVVELRYYILGSAPIQGDYGHQYVYMRDTKTGETVISRAGPSEPISTLAGVSNSTSTAKNGGPVTIQTTMTPASESVDAGRQARVVSGSQTVLKEDIGAAKGQMQKFNNAVDGAKIPYQAQSQNSNSYAGSAYGALTGKTAPTRDVLPGSGNDLRPQIPQCQGASKPCGGN